MANDEQFRRTLRDRFRDHEVKPAPSLEKAILSKVAPSTPWWQTLIGKITVGTATGLLLGSLAWWLYPAAESAKETRLPTPHTQPAATATKPRPSALSRSSTVPQPSVQQVDSDSSLVEQPVSSVEGAALPTTSATRPLGNQPPLADPSALTPTVSPVDRQAGNAVVRRERMTASTNRLPAATAGRNVPSRQPATPPMGDDRLAVASTGKSRPAATAMAPATTRTRTLSDRSDKPVSSLSSTRRRNGRTWKNSLQASGRVKKELPTALKPTSGLQLARTRNGRFQPTKNQLTQTPVGNNPAATDGRNEATSVSVRQLLANDTVATTQAALGTVSVTKLTSLSLVTFGATRRLPVVSPPSGLAAASPKRQVRKRGSPEVGVVLGPTLWFGYMARPRPGWSGGLWAALPLSPSLSVETGLLLSRPSVARSVSGPVVIDSLYRRELTQQTYLWWNVNIPLLVRYRLPTNSRWRWSVAAGLSSVGVINQTLTSDYTLTKRRAPGDSTGGQPSITHSQVVSGGSAGLLLQPFRWLHLSTTLELARPGGHSLAIEPYVSYPIGRVTTESLRVGMVGLQLRLQLKSPRRTNPGQ